VRTIYLSTILALTAVSGISVFLAGFIPESAVPTIKRVGGGLLILYGIYLLFKRDDGDDDEDTENESGWKLFTSHFWVVFIAEMGDKTQIATVAATIQNHSHLFVVFLASASALIAMTTLTVWGVTRIPAQWVRWVKLFGVAGMIAYGSYMLKMA
jgi:putative Ca2+/H+ antiporter (TMEM165/GDT1 family)